MGYWAPTYFLEPYWKSPYWYPSGAAVDTHDYAPVGWVPPREPKPDKPKKKIVKKRRVIRLTPSVEVSLDHFLPSEWYAITWLLRVRVQALEKELASRIKQLQAELDAAQEVALQYEILDRLDEIYEKHDFALEQLVRLREIMLHEEEEFMLFLMMQ